MLAVVRGARAWASTSKSLGSAPLAVARRFFSRVEADAAARRCRRGAAARFLRLWTLKEAYLKAIGTGLAGGLGRMTFVFDDAGACRFERADDARRGALAFQPVRCRRGHVLALAVLPAAPS